MRNNALLCIALVFIMLIPVVIPVVAATIQFSSTFYNGDESVDVDFTGSGFPDTSIIIEMTEVAINVTRPAFITYPGANNTTVGWFIEGSGFLLPS